MKTRFKCVAVSPATEEQKWEGVSLEATVSEENKSFDSETPVASLNMTITNTEAYGFFKKDAEYILDITPVTEA